MLNIKDVVEIPQCGVYAKSPEALKELFSKLNETGYDIQDCSDVGRRGLSREEQEKQGISLWFATLRDNVCEQKGKCGSCGSYIDARGVQTHKHKCEVCGAYTYLHFVDGSTINFHFMNDVTGKRGFLSSDIKMKVFDYDEESACILLYPEPIDGDRFCVLKKSEAKKTLHANRKQFQRIPARLSKGMRKHIRGLKAQGRYREVDAIKARKENRRYGKSLIAIPHILHRVGVINTTESFGHKWNHKIVKLFQGKEYSEWSTLPILESFSIYEAWHWAPRIPSANLHEKIIHSAGMVSRCDFYYQDGRPEFDKIHLERMRLFVENFTIINIDEWDKMISSACKSGPGMIRAIASFCQGVSEQQAQVENNPNIGNVFAGLSKVFSGQKLTDDEHTAMVDTLKDPEEGKKFYDMIG